MSELSNQDLADLELGRQVRLNAALLREKQPNGIEMLGTCAAGLIIEAHKINAQTSTLNYAGMKLDDEPIGDWKITIERTDSKRGGDSGNSA